jgi:hypothetical protein
LWSSLGLALGANSKSLNVKSVAKSFDSFYARSKS